MSGAGTPEWEDRLVLCLSRRGEPTHAELLTHTSGIFIKCSEFSTARLVQGRPM